MFEELQEQRTRNVVRQIPNQLHAAMSKQNAWIELQRITVDDFKSLVAKPRTQKLCKSGILFDRENIICRSNLRLIDNPASEVLIVQKVLTESFGRPDADFLKRRAYL